MSQPPRVLPPLSPELPNTNQPAELHQVKRGNQVDTQDQSVLGTREEYDVVVRTEPSGGHMQPQDHVTVHSSSREVPTIDISGHADISTGVLPVYYSVGGVQQVLPSSVISGQPVVIPVSGTVNLQPSSNHSLSIQQMQSAVTSGECTKKTVTESLTTLPSSFGQNPVSVRGLMVVPMYSGTTLAPSNVPTHDGPSGHNNDALQVDGNNITTTVPEGVRCVSGRDTDAVQADYYNVQVNPDNNLLQTSDPVLIQSGKYPVAVSCSSLPDVQIISQNSGAQFAVAPVPVSDRPSMPYYTLRQKPMHIDLGPCSSAFRSYFHRQQGSKQLHHFISELLNLEENLPPEACFRDYDISSWSLEYYDPDYTEVLQRLVQYSARHRLSSAASGLEQLLALHIKSRRCEGQFRRTSDVADFGCLFKPAKRDACVQTDDGDMYENLHRQNAGVDDPPHVVNDNEPDQISKSNSAIGPKKPKGKASKKQNLNEDDTDAQIQDYDEDYEPPLESKATRTNPGRSKRKIAQTLDEIDEGLPVEDPVKEDEKISRPAKKRTKSKSKKVNKKQKVVEGRPEETESEETANKQKSRDQSEEVSGGGAIKTKPVKTQICDVGIQMGQSAETCAIYMNESPSPRKKRVRHQSEQICFLTCMVCGITFADLEDYRKHEDEHPSGVQYYCEVCDTMFSDKPDFLQHGMMHYGMMEYKCSHCQWYFPTLKHLRDHFAELVPAVRCPICDELLTKFTLNKHLLEHIKGKFSVLQQLHGHQPQLLMVAESQLTAIAVGPKSNKSKNEDDVDEGGGEGEKKKTRKGNGGSGVGQERDRPLRPWMIKDMIGEDVLPEEISEDLKGDVIPVTKFEGEDVFHQGKVINSYTQKTKIPCVHSECEVSKLEPDYLSKALYFPPNTRAVVRAGILKFYNKETFKCTICFKTFSKQLYLEGHYKYVHLNERPHQCEKCMKTFTHATDLGQHIRKHHGDPQTLKCTVCSKVFQDNSSLQKHHQTHCGKVLCDICKKPFNKRYLREHINFVHKQLKIKCNYCGKSFATATARRRCENIHFGTKNYLCADCGKSYFAISDLIQHRKHHHCEETT